MPTGFIQTQAPQFTPGFPHAQYTSAPAGGVNNNIGQLPGIALLPGFSNLQAEGFFAIDSPTRLLKGSNTEIPIIKPLLFQKSSWLTNSASDQLEVKIA